MIYYKTISLFFSFLSCVCLVSLGGGRLYSMIKYDNRNGQNVSSFFGR